MSSGQHFLLESHCSPCCLLYVVACHVATTHMASAALGSLEETYYSSSAWKAKYLQYLEVSQDQCVLSLRSQVREEYQFSWGKTRLRGCI